MADARFERLRSDPRFRRPRKQNNKVLVDDRFKGIFDDAKKKKNTKAAARVDKYGRPLSDTHERENLQRFYRLETNPDGNNAKPQTPDFARGDVLLESSGEDDQGTDGEDDDSDNGQVTLGRDHSKPIVILRDKDEEIDLDESTFVQLDAEAEAYSKTAQGGTHNTLEDLKTHRIAVVNLDWDHVRAVHLYKIFSSLVSPTGYVSVGSDRKHPSIAGGATTVHGKVLNVRVYPSEFGKLRMAKEEEEGPPSELFQKQSAIDNEEVNERNIYEVGDGVDYDEDALRKYQLDRLRYYYAIVTCDSVTTAAHIYTELDGTELERSANVFDLSFVPDDMTFDDDFRDDATEDTTGASRGIDFVTDALRHSKVKLTWDDDDPERNQITRRTLSRKEIEEADFKAYIASSGSESESESEVRKTRKKTGADLRALLLAEDDELPEGWGGVEDKAVDMEITFMPGLSAVKDGEGEETTLEKYQRKQREKRKKRKEEIKEQYGLVEEQAKDDFFGEDSDGEQGAVSWNTKSKRTEKKDRESSPARHVSTAEEIALIVASDGLTAGPNHFDMKSILKAEKDSRRKGKKGKKGTSNDDDDLLQEDFQVDVKDPRFEALHEDHVFAIDPSNPHFKKTKNMSVLLEERSRRRQAAGASGHGVESGRLSPRPETERSLKSLVESVKRKTRAAGDDNVGIGKRRKL